MLKKIVLLIINISFLVSCFAQKDFISVSDFIYKDRIKKTTKYLKEENYMNKLRKELYNKGELSFLDKENSFFIIEGYDLETDIDYVAIFNRKQELNLEVSSEKYKKSKSPLYDKSLKDMIINWDVNRIKKLEKTNSLFGGLDITATKVSLNSDGSLNGIENIYFNQFNTLN